MGEPLGGLDWGEALRSRQAGTGYPSLDPTLTFTRAANLGSGTLRCRGEVVAIGRRTATDGARILDDGGRVVAHCPTTCLLFEY